MTVGNSGSSTAIGVPTVTPTLNGRTLKTSCEALTVAKLTGRLNAKVIVEGDVDASAALGGVTVRTRSWSMMFSALAALTKPKPPCGFQVPGDALFSGCAEATRTLRIAEGVS